MKENRDEEGGGCVSINFSVMFHFCPFSPPSFFYPHIISLLLSIFVLDSINDDALDCLTIVHEDSITVESTR